MLYLYAITDSMCRTFEALRGVDRTGLFTVEASGLYAVVSIVPDSGIAPTPLRLAQHERVVESLMAQGSVVPLRFATLFADDAALRDRLCAEADKLKQELVRLQDRVELGLRVVRMAPDPWSEAEKDGLPCPDLLASERNGRTFEIARRSADLQLQSLRRREESLSEMLHRELAVHAADHRLQHVDRNGLLLKASFLVAIENLDAMREAVHRLVKRHPWLHFLCSGPWPPYHFAFEFEPEASQPL